MPDFPHFLIIKFRLIIAQVKMVHLGRNPITVKGWEEFKNIFIEEDAATGAGQGKVCCLL